MSFSVDDHRFAFIFSENCGSAFLASLFLDTPVVLMDFSKRSAQKMAKISSWVLQRAPLANIGTLKLITEAIPWATLSIKDSKGVKKFKATDDSDLSSSSSSSSRRNSKKSKEKEKEEKKDKKDKKRKREDSSSSS